jgi:hypothetical protein
VDRSIAGIVLQHQYGWPLFGAGIFLDGNCGFDTGKDLIEQNIIRGEFSEAVY